MPFGSVFVRGQMIGELSLSAAQIRGRQREFLQRLHREVLKVIYILVDVQDRPISSSDRFFVSGIV